MRRKLEWKTKKSEIAFDGSPYIVVEKQTVQRHDGKMIYPWYKIMDSNFVVIVPITKTNEVILVSQYRHGAGKISLELPAGKIIKGETLNSTARRELLEETGYTAKAFTQIGKRVYEDPALKSNYFEVYLAKYAEKTGEQMLDETEEINVVRKSFHETIQLALSGEIISPPSVVGILWAAMATGKLFHMA